MLLDFLFCSQVSQLTRVHIRVSRLSSAQKFGVRPGAGAGAASFSRMEDDGGGGQLDVTESEGEDAAAAPEARC